MIWKKTWVSCFLWACFSVIVCVTFSILTISECLEWHIDNRYAVIGLVCLSFLVLLGLYFLLQWLAETLAGKIKLNKHLQRMLEALLVIGSLGFGIFQRIRILGGIEELSQGMPYINRAFVEQGNVIQDAHGVTYLYLQSLRALFLGFGNRAEIAFYFQIVLQVVTALILYELLRNMIGKGAGIFAFIGFMCLPEMVERVTDASYFNFLMLFFALGVRSLWRFYKKSANGWYALFYGILVAILFFLDCMAIALVLAALCILSTKDENSFGRKLRSLGIFFLAFILGIALLLGAQMFLAQGSFLQISANFGNTILSEFGSIQMVDYILTDHLLINLVLYGILFFLVIGFFERNNTEQLSPFVLLLAVWICKREYRIYLEIMLAAMALYLLYVPKKGQVVAEEKEVLALPKVKVVLPEMAPLEEQKISQVEAKEKPVVTMIKNPLPVPKKHVAKALDYDITKIKEVDDDYDYPVDDDDDFDK